MKNKYAFGLVGFLVTAIFYGMSYLESYNEIKQNYLFIFFMFVIFSYGASMLGDLLTKEEKKSKKEKKEVKSDVFKI